MIQSKWRLAFLCFAVVGLQSVAGQIFSSCVEQSGSNNFTIVCSDPNFVIALRQAFYARAYSYNPNFCTNVQLNATQGYSDCIPDRDGDTAAFAVDCNRRRSCSSFTRRPLFDDVVSHCGIYSGQVYLYVSYECAPSKISDGNDITFYSVDSNAAGTENELLYFGTTGYTALRQTTGSVAKCQMTLPTNTQAWFHVYDLRGRFTDSSAAGIPYTLNITAGSSSKAWSASSVWYRDLYPFYVYPSNTASKVDITFTDGGPTAYGAFWVFVQVSTTSGSYATGIGVACGSSITSVATSSTTTTTTTPTPTPTTSTSTTTSTPTSTSTSTTTTTPTSTSTSTTTTTPPSTTRTSTTTTPTTSTSTTTTTTTTTTPTPTPTPTSTSSTTTSTPTTTKTSTTSTTTTTTPTSTTRTSTSTSTTPTSTSTSTSRTTTTTTTTTPPTSTSSSTPSTSTATTSTTTTTTTTPHSPDMFSPDGSSSTSLSGSVTTMEGLSSISGELSTSTGHTETASDPAASGGSTSNDNKLAIIIGCCVGGGVLLLLILIIAAVCAAKRRHRSAGQPSHPKLPDVVGTWAWDSGHGDPGVAVTGSELGLIDADTVKAASETGSDDGPDHIYSEIGGNVIGMTVLNSVNSTISMPSRPPSPPPVASIPTLTAPVSRTTSSQRQPQAIHAVLQQPLATPTPSSPVIVASSPSPPPLVVNIPPPAPAVLPPPQVVVLNHHPPAILSTNATISPPPAAPPVAPPVAVSAAPFSPPPPPLFMPAISAPVKERPKLDLSRPLPPPAAATVAAVDDGVPGGLGNFVFNPFFDPLSPVVSSPPDPSPPPELPWPPAALPPLPAANVVSPNASKSKPAADVKSPTSPMSPTKSILVDSATSPHRPPKGQVRFTTPDDSTVQYPGRGPTVMDEDHAWKSRTLMNSKDRHPSVLDAAGRQRRKAAEAARAAALTRPSLTAPHVTAVQATDNDAQQNPLYGQAMEMFIY